MTLVPYVYAGRAASDVCACLRVSSAKEHGVLDRAMMFDGFSKTYCMTGWRLGWAIMPEPLAERQVTASISSSTVATRVHGHCQHP